MNDTEKNPFNRFLIDYVNRGFYKKIPYIVSRGADIHATYYDDKRSLLHQVALNYDSKMPIKTARVLLDLGCDINKQDNDGRTPIMIATLYKNVKLVEFLKENGARLDIQDNSGANVHIIAAMNNQVGILEVLLDHPNKKNTIAQIDQKEKLNEVFEAAQKGFHKKLKNFINDKEILHAIDGFGDSLLITSCYYCNRSCVELLVGAGIDINIQNERGETAMMIAANAIDIDIVKYLLDHDADPLLKNEHGKTAIDYAIDKSRRYQRDLDTSNKILSLINSHVEQKMLSSCIENNLIREKHFGF